MFKVDLHTHVIPRDLPDFSKRFGRGGFPTIAHLQPTCADIAIDGRFFRRIGENCWSPQVRIEECDRHGINVQVLSTIPVMFSYWASPQEGTEVARYLNDHVAALVAEYPRRFVGLGTLPMQSPQDAVRELERCVTMLGLAGVQIGTHVNAWNLDAPELFPVFETAQSLGAAVFVHPWEMMGAKEMPKYWLPWLVGMPAECARAICSMIFGGVFERLPRLRVAFAHGGGSFVGTLGRIERGFHVRPDLCAVDNPVNPRSYLGKFYVDSLVHDASALRYLIDTIGVSRIALGSDYPFPLGEEVPGSLIASLELPEKDRNRLFAGTAMEFLGLEWESYNESSSLSA